MTSPDEQESIATDSPVLFSLDFAVTDLDQCITLLVELAGLELVGRARHPTFDAEVAQIRAGSVVLNLLQPTETGGGRPFTSPAPSLSNLTLVLPHIESVRKARQRLVAGGAAVFAPSDDQFGLDAQMIKGLLGVESAVIFRALTSLVVFS